MAAESSTVTDADEITALRQELVDAQRRLQAVAELSGEPLATLEFALRDDGELVFVRADEAAQRLVSVASPEYYGRRLLEVFTGMAGTTLPADLVDTARHGRGLSPRAFIPPGTRLGRAFSMFAFQPAPARVVLKFWESTTVADLHEIGRRNQEFLTRLFSDSPVAIALTRDAGQSIVDVNTEWSRVTGWPRHEVLGRTLGQLGLCSDEQAQALLQDSRLLRDVELPLVTRDGHHATVSLHGAGVEIGGVRHHLLYMADISGRKAAEVALRLRDVALRTSLNAVAMSDMAGRLTYVNDAFVELWGLADERDALGCPVEDFWSDPDSARAVVAALIGGAGTWRGELVGQRRDGSRFDVATWATLAAGVDGQPIGLMASFLDITERKRGEAQQQQLNATLDARVRERTRELEAALVPLQQAQDELVRSEKMASLGALVAGVAHELNTPIGNAVMVASTLSGRQREFEAGMAGGLRRSALDAFLASTREVSEVLERNLQRAAELIGSFKQIAVDQSSYQRRSFELGEVVQEIALALSPTLRHSGVRLVDEVAPGLAMDSFPGPLGQVLINLVNNAVLHAFEGQAAGTVRIGAEQLAGDRVHLWVRDDGRGIAREHLRQVFDPFFTTRLGQGGSGLGLHIVYTLVTGLLGGRIEVHSTPGQGTALRIELPRVAPSGPSTATASG